METAPLKRVAFFTLGCKTNQYDTEAMQELFIKHGYKVVDFEDYSDVYVINTCTVTNLGDRKSRQMIRRAHRCNPDAVIAVVGCYVQRAVDEVLEIPGVRVVLGTKNRNRIVEFVEYARKTGNIVNGVENIMKERIFEETPIETYGGKTRAALKIQEGCNQFCSYCIIPYARGPIRSRRLESVQSEVERLVKAGFKEVVLTGIHIASYGKDLKDTNLLDLLQSIHDIQGLERIRIGSVEPHLLSEEFVNAVKQLPKVCRHYHISLQSGCDATLKRMNRKYTTSEYKAIVDRLRANIPDTAVTTDIMVGFPGETDEEFAQTLAFTESIAFSKIHVFQYSPREGTPAATFENQVPGDIKEKRSHQLIELGNRLERAYISKFIGQEVTVLFEREAKQKGYMEGHTDHYVNVMVPGDISMEGKLLLVRITGLDGDVLLGNCI